MKRPDSQGVVCVFAKAPIPGKTKTRLLPVLAPTQAAALSECFLKDTIARVRQVGDQVEVSLALAHDPTSSAEYFSSIAGDFDLRPQKGVSLGERMHLSSAQYLLEGSPFIVIIGTDIPCMREGMIIEAIEQLQSGTDVVFGPAEDGGYYLIGIRQAQSDLLQQVTMSTPDVLQDSLAICESKNLNVHLLESCYDIDRPEDLQRLHEEQQPIGQHTKDWLIEDSRRRVILPATSAEG